MYVHTLSLWTIQSSQGETSDVWTVDLSPIPSCSRSMQIQSNGAIPWDKKKNILPKTNKSTAKMKIWKIFRSLVSMVHLHSLSSSREAFSQARPLVEQFNLASDAWEFHVLFTKRSAERVYYPFAWLPLAEEKKQVLAQFDEPIPQRALKQRAGKCSVFGGMDFPKNPQTPATLCALCC